jgi:enamine deaminase RidA (YjgF/YER057c/UK114 family)
MSIEIFNPEQLMSTSKYGYAHAVRVGNQVWIAGQNAWHKENRVVGPGDIDAQSEYVFESLQIALAAAGSSLQHVVKMTNYLTSADFLRGYLLTRRRFMQGHTPASTTVVVSSLAHPDLLVEVDVIAVVP